MQQFLNALIWKDKIDKIFRQVEKVMYKAVCITHSTHNQRYTVYMLYNIQHCAYTEGNDIIETFKIILIERVNI